MEIRAARPTDHADFARLFVELGVPDRVPDAASWWRKRGADTRIADDAGRVVGCSYVERVGDTLYVRNVISDPSRRRTGIGRALVRDAVRRGLDAGLASWCLNVADDNVAARALYASFGLREAYASLVIHLRWDRIEALPPCDDDVTVRPVAAADDDAIDAALGLLPGLLAQERGRAKHVLVALQRGAPVGLASFDPAFPGVYPFRATSLSVARALLVEAARHRQPFTEDTWRKDAVQLVVERDEALGHAVLQSGGVLVFRILHLRGALRDAIPMHP